MEYCTAGEYSATTDNHTDVGVVAVPNNCTPDKSVRLVSVPFMSMKAPDNGIVVVGPDSVAGGEQEFLHFGEKNIKSKKECAEIPTWDNRAESPSYSTSSSGYLSTDVNSGKTQNTEGPKSYYHDSPFVVPPYDENEELVKEYSTGSFGDFDSKKNTKAILEMPRGKLIGRLTAQLQTLPQRAIILRPNAVGDSIRMELIRGSGIFRLWAS